MHKKTFAELTKKELYELLKLRAKVFVVEQNQAYLDLDDYDYKAIHYFIKENDIIVSYLRVLPVGYFEGEHGLGRVVSDISVRNKGYIKNLIHQAIQDLKKTYPGEWLTISAQTYLIPFYESFGFIVKSVEYLEDNLPHKKMKRLL